MIRLATPSIDTSDCQAVVAVLRSGRLVNGPEATAFEEALCSYTGAANAVVVSSGTTALQLALQTATQQHVRPEVLVPAFTYPATAHAVHLAGARAVLVDVDERTWNLDADAAAAATTPDTVAVLPVDQFGNPADVDRIGRACEVAAGSPITLIDDAACALGARRGDSYCGADVALACLSFHPRKIITTGEGGVILTASATLAARLRAGRNHGRDSAGRFVGQGANCRMSELAAALGRSQLRRIETMLDRRRQLAARYVQRLEGHRAWTLQQTLPGFTHAFQTFAVCLEESYSRDAVISQMQAHGVEATIGTFGVHRQPPYDEGIDPDAYPIADRLANQTMAIPLHPRLTETEVDTVCRALERAVLC